MAITIINKALLDLKTINAVITKLKSAFNTTILIRNDYELDTANAYNPARNQYNSTVLLSSLLNKYSNLNGKIICIIPHDLFIPVLTYIYGEAELEGKSAIVSTTRLYEEFYGLPDNDELFVERLIKELIHELGHTFGLIHCPLPYCVMHSATSIEDVDIKLDEFCSVCAGKLSE